MQKIALYFGIFLTLILGIVAVAGEKPDRLAGAKKRFPYSLIGNDHEILSPDDLAIPTCHAIPSPYTEGHGKDGNSAIYWRCFSAADVVVDCKGGGYDPDEKEILTVMGIIIKEGTEINEYMTRRAIPLRGCKSWQKDWKKLSRHQDHVCFSGSPLNKEVISENGRETQRRSWIFESFKTHLGCSSYFEGGCSLPYQLRHGCKVIEAKVDR